MRPATIRRLLVFGVCALGVGALYLVPDVSGTPGQRAGSRLADPVPEPAGRPVAYDGRTTMNRPGTSSGQRAPVTGGGTELSSEQPQRAGADRRTSTTPRRDSVGASANRSRADGPDEEPPSVVSELSFPTVTTDRLTVRWPAAADNVGVTEYRVWLNGYHVADTTTLQVAIPWFKDGSREQVVQVRAVDAAGNQSIQAPAQLVVRPDPGPDPAPASRAPATSAPPASGSPSPAPTTGAPDDSAEPATPGAGHTDGIE